MRTRCHLKVVQYGGALGRAEIRLVPQSTANDVKSWLDLDGHLAEAPAAAGNMRQIPCGIDIEQDVNTGTAGIHIDEHYIQPATSDLDGQVHGDIRLSNAPLAAGDGHHSGSARRRGG